MSEPAHMNKGGYSMGGSGIEASMAPHPSADKRNDLVKKPVKLTKAGIQLANACCGYMQKEKAEMPKGKLNEPMPPKTIKMTKSMEDSWLCDLGDKVKKIAALNKISYNFDLKPVGTSKEYTFKVGDCQVVYKTMGTDSKVTFSQGKEADFRNVAIAKTLFYSIQRFHSGEHLIRKSDETDSHVQARINHMEALAPHEHAHGHSQSELYSMSLPKLRALRDKHAPMTETHTRVGGSKGQGYHTKQYTVAHTGKQHTEKSLLTSAGQALVKKWTSWQGQEQGKNQLKRQKQRRKKALGVAQHKPTKSVGEYRLRTQGQRMMGQKEHIIGKTVVITTESGQKRIGKSFLTAKGEQFVKAFGLAPKKYVKPIGAPRAAMAVKPQTHRGASIIKIGVPAAIKPKAPTVKPPKIASPKLSKEDAPKKIHALVPSEREKACTDHKFSYTGKVPNTGPRKCTMCGTHDIQKDGDIAYGGSTATNTGQTP